jgi:uncharacterized membrane protein YphA (DoxX/SURF4 family)
MKTKLLNIPPFTEPATRSRADSLRPAQPPARDLPRRLWALKVASRVALGLVWFYEGLVPKLLFLRADEIEIARRLGLVWHSPEFTLQALGVTQIFAGLWLLIGRAERLAVAFATAEMLVLIVLVACGNPAMLTDPYGALVKDFCLITSALAVWLLAPIVPDAKTPRA